jgi:hypothetical protein
MVMGTLCRCGRAFGVYGLLSKAQPHKFEFSFLNGNLMVPAASLLMFAGGRDASGPPYLRFLISW